jgi:Spy/CpxP family protein refolding chaperone
MTNRIFNALAVAALSTSFLVAQTTTTGRTPPTVAERVAHRVARLTALLTLTTTQQAQATTLFTTEETALDAIRTDMQTLRTSLQTAVKANNSSAIVTVATQIGADTTKQVEAQATADAAFYALLTTDQQTKFNELNTSGFGGRGFGGPGGPGGPGGHGPH